MKDEPFGRKRGQRAGGNVVKEEQAAERRNGYWAGTIGVLEDERDGQRLGVENVEDNLDEGMVRTRTNARV